MGGDVGPHMVQLHLQEEHFLASTSLIKPVMNRTTPVMNSVMPALNSLTPVNEPITPVNE